MTADKSDPMLVAGQRLADILRKKKAFTNTATFDLKCEVRAIVPQESERETDAILILGLRSGFGRRERSTSSRERDRARPIWRIYQLIRINFETLDSTELVYTSSQPRNRLLVHTIKLSR